MKKLEQFELKNVEYKEAKNKLPDNIYKTISAFANTRGGVIYLGIKQEGVKIIRQGVENPQKLVDDLVSTVSEKYNFCPVINPVIEKSRNKYFVKISVNEALRNEKPIYIKDAGPVNGGYRRFGSADIHLTDREVHWFYMEREGAPDGKVLRDSSIKDIDRKTIEVFKDLYAMRNKNARRLPAKTVDLLRAYKLLSKDGKRLTMAGVLLFGKVDAVREYIPHFRVDVIRIRGLEWGKDRDPFLSTDLIGNLLNIRMQVLDIFDRFFLTPFKMGKNLTRIEDDPFKNAIREALSNLLMHQNYYHHSPSQVRIYNDRIEFYNPGHSLKNPDDFAIPGSEPRNALIPPVFYDIGWAESKGTGFQTQILELEKFGLPTARWENDERHDRFTIVFPYPQDEVAQRTTDQVTGQVTGQVAGQVAGQVTPQVAQQVTQQVEMRDRIAKVLKYCEEPRYLKEIMRFLDLKHRENILNQIINPLLEKRYLRRTIPTKPKSRFQKYITNRKKNK